MPRLSAGLLMFKRRKEGLEVYLVHPGGPFWQKKDIGAWSIPKGEVSPGEDSLAAARREFEEEIGVKVEAEWISLGEIRQAGGKSVTAWAFEGDSPLTLRSNKFSMEWPPKSGRIQEFPEVDRAEWFSIEEARRRINLAQAPFLDRLLEHFPLRKK